MAALVAESTGLRACALLDPAGLVLARSSAGGLGLDGRRDLGRGRGCRQAEPTQVHVATEDGEVYAVAGTGAARRSRSPTASRSPR